MAMNEVELERIVTRLVGDATSYQKMLDVAQTATRQASEAIQASGRKIEGVSSSLDAFSSNAMKAMSAVQNIASGTGGGVSAFSDFNSELTKSVAIMDNTAAQTERMSKAALDLSTKSAVAPKDLAHSFYYLASAGMKAEQAIGALPIVQRFAAAGAMDMSTATELAAGSQAALGMKSADTVKNLENLAKVTDVVVRASKLAQGTTQQYGQALARDAASSMRTYGIQLEEGVAVLATYGDQNIQASIAGSSYGRTLRLLAQAARENSAEHKKLGFSVFDSSGKMKNMADIMENLENILGGLSPEAKAATLDMIGFQALAQRAITPLIGMSSKIREFQKQLESAGGWAEKVAGKQMTSFANQMILVKNTLTVAAIEIGSYVAPAFVYIGEVIKTLTKTWMSFSQETKKTVVALGAFLAISAGRGVFASLLTSITALVSSGFAPLITGITVLAGVIANPFKLLINWMNPTFVLLRNVVSIIAALVVYVQKSGGIGDAWRNFEEALIEVYYWLEPIMDALKELGGAILQKLIQAFISMGETMLSTIQKVAGMVNVDWQQVQTGIITGIKFIEFIVLNIEKIVTMIGKGLYALIQPMIASFSTGEKSASKFSISLEVVVRHLVTVGIILVASVITWKLVATSIALVSGVWKLLHLDLILGTALWITMNTVILAFKLILTIAAATMSVFGGVSLFVGSSLIGLAAAFSVLGSSIIALLVFGPVLLTAVLGTLGVVVAGLVSPFVGLYLGIYELTKAFQSLPRDIGAIATIGAMFKEWGSSISMIVSAMSIDMGLAWRIFQATVELGVAQIKALWPSLWEAIKTGFSESAILIKNVIGEAFTYIKERIKLSRQYWTGFLDEEGFKFATEQLGRQFELNVALHSSNAARAIRQSMEGVEIVDNDQINDARSKIKTLGDELANAQFIKEFEQELDALSNPIADSTAQAKKAAEDLAKTWGDKTGPAMKKGAQEAQAVQQAIWGSVDAMGRLQHYTDMFDMNAIKDATVKSAIAPATAIGPISAEMYKPLDDKINEARDVLNAYNNASDVVDNTENIAKATEFATNLSNLFSSGADSVSSALGSLFGGGEEQGVQVEAVRSYEAQRQTTLDQILETLRDILKSNQKIEEDDLTKFFEDMDNL